jgi:hypothetical protein
MELIPHWVWLVNWCDLGSVPEKQNYPKVTKMLRNKIELIYGVYPPFTDATGSVMFDPLISLLLSRGTTWNS